MNFKSYNDMYIAIKKNKCTDELVQRRIEFHQAVIDFLMGVPDYATDAYIFEKIANLKLE